MTEQAPASSTAPATAPTPAPAPAAQKKTLLDAAPVKGLFIVLGYIAPVPMLLSLTQLWLAQQAPGKVRTDALSLFRQYFHGGADAPWYLVPLSLVPSLLLCGILFRSPRQRVVAMAAVPALGLAGAVGFLTLFLN
jgi:hypothetical protein